MYNTVVDAELEAEIKELSKLRRKYKETLNHYTELLDKKNKLLDKLRIKKFFESKKCSSCYQDLSEEDCKNNIIYCEECRDTDSVLNFNCNYPESDDE